MKKGIGTPENRELAFAVYTLFGGRNIHRILIRLEHVHGLSLSARTLYKWKDEGNWDGRLGRAGAAGKCPPMREVLTFEERLLSRVMGLLEKYERHFETNDAVRDAQAAYAYTNLLRAAMELSRRMKFWETKGPVDGLPPGSTPPA